MGGEWVGLKIHGKHTTKQLNIWHSRTATGRKMSIKFFSRTSLLPGLGVAQSAKGRKGVWAFPGAELPPFPSAIGYCNSVPTNESLMAVAWMQARANEALPAYWRALFRRGKNSGTTVAHAPHYQPRLFPSCAPYHPDSNILRSRVVIAFSNENLGSLTFFLHNNFIFYFLFYLIPF